jgi:two-component system NtrC family sensor kinase
VKLALFGAVGVVLTHAVHLVVANRIAARTLSTQVGREGRALAQAVAREAADPLLAGDQTSVQELVDSVATAEDVAWCFIEREGRVLASSFRGGTPSALLRLRHHAGPLAVRAGGKRYLDVAEAVLGGTAGVVRVGLRLELVQPMRRRLALALGTIATLVIGLGVVAAFLVGRRVARPVGAMVAALEDLDPSVPPVPIAEGGADEIGLLAQQVNAMRARLHRTHLAEEEARRRQFQTEKLAALGTLVAGVAHEVNNPLAGVMNCHRGLCKEGLADERRKEYLELMEEGLGRIERVVGQLLDFARPRAPRRSRERIGALLGSTSNLLRAAVDKRGVEVSVELGAASELAVVVDAGQIQQALLNLLLNAVYVTAAGSRVEVRARLEGDSGPRAEDGAAGRPNRVGIEIEDHGPGVPPELRGKIEDPFFTTKPEGEGTGLGLSVTRSIASAHGGDLAYSFPDSGGTIVTLWLPLATEA